MIQKILNLFKSKEFQKFFVIGVSAFLVDFILLQVMLKLFNIPEEEHLKQTIVNICSTAIAILYNYTIQRKWAFKSKNKNVAAEASKFVGVQIFNIVVFQTILFSVVNYFFPAWLTKFFVSGIAILSSFFLYKLFVFKNKKEEQIIEAVVESAIN